MTAELGLVDRLVVALHALEARHPGATPIMLDLLEAVVDGDTPALDTARTRMNSWLDATGIDADRSAPVREMLAALRVCEVSQ